MLEEVCRYLNNWFDVERLIGEFTILDGEIIEESFHEAIQSGQYFRVVGSVFNDGVYQFSTTFELPQDERFDGGVWLMSIPQSFLDLVKEIEEWQAKYGGIDSQAMSPYTSESFGGYSYTKSNGSADGSTTSSNAWQSAFQSRLSKWRKIKI